MVVFKVDQVEGRPAVVELDLHAYFAGHPVTTTALRGVKLGALLSEALTHHSPFIENSESKRLLG